ncbi:MAG: DnaA/Hda family protein [Wolbachia endosymbiont of Tyrophagus putrescentiae]|nr:DnaA/Hda family protein [Wolbachia endosymbiont of Tyrophagus putrescentiae]
MQLSLFDNNKTDYSHKNYIVLEENRSVYNTVINNLSWQCLILCGPRNSGKTHLAHIWRSTNDAIFINPHNFISDIRYSNAFILEDIHNIQDEATLLHCYNYLQENRKRLLMTSSFLPKDLSFKLKDLHSRILSTMSVKIPPANEELLRIMLIKKFSDKQLKVDLKVIDYILMRIERSFNSISDVIEKIDHKSMGKNITIPFVSSLLTKHNL